MRTLSTVPNHRAVSKFTSELGTPLYTGQPPGSQRVSSIERFRCIQDSQLGPNGVLHREVPLYTGRPPGSQHVLYREVPL